jgi:hypothetical protein
LSKKAGSKAGSKAGTKVGFKDGLRGWNKSSARDKLPLIGKGAKDGLLAIVR